MNLARAAYLYAHHGRRVFPLVPGAKRPATMHGVKDATSNVANVCALWTKTPDANIGLAIEPFELVIDVDVRNGGDESLLKWFDEHGSFPRTPTQTTPTTGTHFFFARPADVELIGKPAPGIDVLGAGKYVVAAPSRIEGREAAYEWTTKLSKTPLAPLPDWLASLVLRPPSPAPKPPPQFDRPAADVIARAEKYLLHCEPAIQGSGGSSTCFRVAVKIARGFALDEDTALDVIERVYNPRCDPPWTRRELRHKVKQAIAKGDLEWGALRDAPRRGAA